MDNVEYRKSIYKKFAKKANSQNIKWAVLHGIEGYPNTIGRDLDITCQNEKEEQKLLEIFEEVVKAHPQTNWSVTPTKIWGARILGISKDFDVAELHIIRPMRLFIMSFQPNWSECYFVGETFPVSKYMSFVKAGLMPSISNESWKHKLSKLPEKKELPSWLVKTVESMSKNEFMSNKQKLRLFFDFFVQHPLRSVFNLYFWLRRKSFSHNHPTTPIVRVSNPEFEDIFVEKVGKNLSKIFLAVVNGNDLSNKQIKRLQARQKLVYITKQRTDIEPQLIIKDTLLSTESFNSVLIDSFNEFNLRSFSKND